MSSQPPASDRTLAIAARIAQLAPTSLRDSRVVSRSSAGGAAFSELGLEDAEEEITFPYGYKVLHVDDDAFVRMTLPLTTFITVGVDYAQAVHGGEALQLLQAGERFDFFVVDSQMPMMGGGPFTRELRSKFGFTVSGAPRARATSRANVATLTTGYPPARRSVSSKFRPCGGIYWGPAWLRGPARV